MGQSEVARALKIPIATYNRLETGTFVRAPEPATLRRLADYFGVTRGWLWFGEGEKYATPIVVIRDEPEDAHAERLAPARSVTVPRKVVGGRPGRRGRG
jgi:transcriptional regulator with XRE-family HTH domain